MSGLRSRRKGANFEREIANVLKAIWPGARRGLGQARSAKEVCDVEGTPWWVECKRCRKVSIPSAVRQAKAATDGRPILVIAKNDRQPVVVVWEDEGRLVEMGLPRFLSQTSSLRPSPSESDAS